MSEQWLRIPCSFTCLWRSTTVQSARFFWWDYTSVRSNGNVWVWPSVWGAAWRSVSLEAFLPLVPAMERVEDVEGSWLIWISRVVHKRTGRFFVHLERAERNILRNGNCRLYSWMLVCSCPLLGADGHRNRKSFWSDRGSRIFPSHELDCLDLTDDYQVSWTAPQPRGRETAGPCEVIRVS